MIKLITIALVGSLAYVAAGKPTLNQMSHNTGVAFKHVANTAKGAELAFERGWNHKAADQKQPRHEALAKN